MKCDMFCKSFNIHQCEFCGDDFVNCQNYTGDKYCKGTINHSTFFCEKCLKDILEEDEETNDKKYDKKHICSHIYTPLEFRFININESDQLHFGIELEVAYKGKYSPEDHLSSLGGEYYAEIHAKSKALLSKISKWAYLKQDGSIENCGYDGFEIVTHPLSWQWINSSYGQEQFDAMFNLSKSGFISYDTNSCGMHIHVDKKHFENIHLYNMIKFFNKNRAFISKISQREHTQLEAWAPINEENNLRKRCRCRIDNQRSAINLMHRDTIEFRIFRGTLKKHGFMKNIQFIKSMIDYIKSTKTKDIRLESYIEYVFRSNDLSCLQSFLTTMI